MKRLHVVLFFCTICTLAGCGDSSKVDDTPDGGSDTDADSDTDTDTDANGSEYAWHTFFGSAGYDYGGNVAADAAGNVYVYGGSGAGWVGPSGEPPLVPFGGAESYYLLKLDADGGYLWHTFFAGDEPFWGIGFEIAVDDTGAAYMAGFSHVPWNGPSGEAPLESQSGDATFVIKFDTNGAYQWHTFFEGNGYGTVAVHGDTVVLAGDGPEWTGPEGQEPLRAATGPDEAYVVALDADGGYLWHTYLGAQHSERVALGPSGEIYVTGSTDASWQGPSGEAPIHDLGTEHGNSIYIVKLDADGGYLWHTFHGDDYVIQPTATGVDADGSFVVTGTDTGLLAGPSDEPPVQGPYDQGDLGESFALALDADGGYRWHTYLLAEDGVAAPEGAAFDAAGNLAVAGHAYRDDDAFRFLSEDPDASMYHYEWLTFLTEDGALDRTVSFGAHDDDLGKTNGMAATPTGGFLVVGSHYVEWLGPSGEAPLHAFSGDSDLSVCAFEPM